MMDFSANSLVFFSFLVGSSLGHITVYNGMTPDSIQNFGPVDSQSASAEPGQTQALLDTSPVAQPSGIIQHNRYVGSQENYAMTARRRRFIEQNIHTVLKQINISKRDVRDQEGNKYEPAEARRVKRCTQDVKTIHRQTNVDMGARKRNIYQNIDEVRKQINISK